MTHDELKKYFKTKQEIINQALDRYLPKEGKLAEAMRYSVFAGGKRLRPILCLATAEALGKSEEPVIPLASAIEMLHTFTLIHDDLPAMDNSDLRRGKPTSHKVFGEALALLAGDALNTLAFTVLSENTNSQIVSEIGHALLEVVAGQISDLETKEGSLETLKIIHRQKTGALLRACVKSAAMLGNASSLQMQSLILFAEHLGLAFQIADDILDVTSSAEKLGKPVKADEKKGFPFAVGLEPAKQLAVAEKEKALAALANFDEKARRLREIAEYVIKREE